MRQLFSTRCDNVRCRHLLQMLPKKPHGHRSRRRARQLAQLGTRRERAIVLVITGEDGGMPLTRVTS